MSRKIYKVTEAESRYLIDGLCTVEDGAVVVVALDNGLYRLLVWDENRGEALPMLDENPELSHKKALTLAESYRQIGGYM